MVVCIPLALEVCVSCLSFLLCFASSHGLRGLLLSLHAIVWGIASAPLPQKKTTFPCPYVVREKGSRPCLFCVFFASYDSLLLLVSNLAFLLSFAFALVEFSACRLYHISASRHR
jgi:hypothetical protein